MKKVLVTVAALGLVAGVATTASAVEWKMSGQYVVDGIYLDSATTNGVLLTEAAGVDNSSDAWFMHTFQVNPTMKVNDKISMAATVRLADDTVWGGQTGGDTVQNGSNMGGDVYVHQLYMDYVSPIGKVRVGRVPAGPFGTSFLDTDTRQDRIMWWPTFLPKPWSALFFYAKLTDNEYNVATPTKEDSDRYEARLYYTAEGTDLGVAYANINATSSTGAYEDEKQFVDVYGKLKFAGNYFANFEVIHNFGSQSATKDYDSLAAMVELGGKFDNLTASATYFYASGDNNSTDGDVENALGSAGTGTEFEPLYILTGRTAGMLNNDFWAKQTVGGNGAYTATMSGAGVQAFVLSANYAVSNALSLHGAIGYAEADEETAGYDDEYGWEYNIGAAYKLLDNLTYEAHFGYLDTGDYFKAGNAATNTENVYMLSHHLTMTF